MPLMHPESRARGSVRGEAQAEDDVRRGWMEGENRGETSGERRSPCAAQTQGQETNKC